VNDVIEVTLNLDENIVVTGTPRVELLSESKSTLNIFANYVSGSGTSALVFEYLVKSGDGDSNGLDISTSLNIIGASILDTAENPLSLTSTNFASVLIDSQSPMITSFIEPANATYADGAGELLFQVNFSEIVILLEVQEFR
jgi:hypothetical protein